MDAWVSLPVLPLCVKYDFSEAGVKILVLLG